ncbi:MAG: hypothetical protein R3D98_11645 [Candidatus Krumholzibacteriia bacterium]
MTAMIAAILLATALGIPGDGWEDLDWMFGLAELEAGAAGATLFCLPDGGGRSFTAAHAPGGLLVDATVALSLADYSGNPIVGYPAEDLWLITSAGGLAACPLGTSADGPTGSDGRTRWTQPLRAGGHSLGETLHVVVSGYVMARDLDLEFRSADLNGDLAVDLSDVAAMTVGLAAGAATCDLNNDYQVNLADVVAFVSGLGAACP